ncbi:Bax inhibitor 1-related [Parasponia andersonii]|uniref:Bax inhibitor 1-related n=1 Tax=Parasponia andersonii TaxID=3476 RepID=A0A2P5E3W5_PARAD|nr:Bax inhibitor 1-related [Parasponia andersonii]
MVRILLGSFGAEFSRARYAIWAAKNAKNLSFLGPLVFTGLVSVIATSLVQEVFHPMSPICPDLYAAVAPVLLFSSNAVYSTKGMLKQFRYDDYIVASITLNCDLLKPVAVILPVLHVVVSVSRSLS